MNVRVAVVLTACLVVSLSIGCQSPSGIVRGQTPVGMHQPPGPPPMATPQLAQPGAQGRWIDQFPQGAFHGSHHHTFEYKVPKNLRYPPMNQPAAIQQYPYYTLRGPTDFFYK